MMKKLFLILSLFAILLLGFSTSGFSTIYYVNTASTGTGDGTTQEITGEHAAWKTIAEVSAFMGFFNAGDSILFNMGNTWQQSTIFYITDSGESGNPITFGSYGDGDKPIISILGALTGWTTAGNWTEEDGVGVNIWSISYAGDPNRLVLDGTEYKEAESEADITITYRWHSDTGVTKLYVYATENPSTFYSSIEAYVNIVTLYLNAVSYVTVENLDIQSGVTAIRIREGGYNIIDSCQVGKYSHDGIAVFDSSHNEIKNNVVDSQIPDWSSDTYFTSVNPVEDGIKLRINYNTADCSYNEIYDNTVIDWGHTGISFSNPTSDANTIHHNEVYLNEIYAENSPVLRGWGILGDAVGRCANNLVYQNNCHDMSVSCQVGGDHNEFYYNLIHDIAPTAATSVDPTGIRLAIEPGKIAENNKIYNNTIYNVYNYGIYLQYVSGTDYLENNLFKNNVISTFPEVSAYGIRILNNATYIKTNTFENNLIWSSGVDDVVLYYSVAKTITEFNALDEDTGNTITDNISSDPLMIDPANGDFKLNPHSPCVNAGTDVSLTEDYEGLKIRHAPDIGAYENQANALFFAWNLFKQWWY